MARFYLEVKDLRNQWTMVHIDDDDDDWDQRSMPSRPIASGSGDVRRMMQIVALFDEDTGRKVVQLYLGNGQRFRQGEAGSGLAAGATPALEDGPIEWKCTAWYED